MTIHDGHILGARAGLRVISCRACGFAHLETLPDASDLAKFYAEDFWTKEKPGALERIEAQRDWWNEIYGDWLKQAERAASPNVPKTILDVGCGYGHFLRRARALGWSVQGVEASPHAASHAATLVAGVWCGSWEESPYRTYANLMGCVSALWLIEHLPDPLAFLRWAHDILVPGGVLLAVVPSDFSPIQMRVNDKVRKRYWFVDKTHVSYFTPESFANLLGRAGFRIVERSTLYPVERFLTAGMDYTNNPVLGARLYDLVTERDLHMTQSNRVAFYRALARRGEGREIVVVAVRDE